MHILVGLILVFVVMALFVNRKTRACRWREDRSVVPTRWRCAFCGAQTTGPSGTPPKICFRDDVLTKDD